MLSDSSALAPRAQGNIEETPARGEKDNKTVVVTSWVQEGGANVETIYLKCLVLKNGGLTTVYLPYNEVGATEDRDTLNLGAAAWLVERGLFSPKILKLNAAGFANSHRKDPSEARALYYQMETIRNGRSNPLHAIAPGWTSLYHNGYGGLSAQPKHICSALAHVVASMPKYSGLDIYVVDNNEQESVSLQQLCERTDILMLPPPIPQSMRGGSDAATMRAEIASLKRERDERAADEHIDRLVKETAEPILFRAGEWQGGGSAPATPARALAHSAHGPPHPP